MEMFISFRGNINLYPKGVNWPPCLNQAIVVLNISFPVWLIQAKITPWGWIPNHEDRSLQPFSTSFLLMWLGVLTSKKLLFKHNYTLRTNSFLTKGSLKSKQRLISWVELDVPKDNGQVLHPYNSMGLVNPTYTVHYDWHMTLLIEQMCLWVGICMHMCVKK